MARLVGFIANRPDLCNRLALYEREALSTRNVDPDKPWGWGIGFFHSGEILLKRRPLDDRTELRIDQMIDEVRSDILIAHVRNATVGALRTGNTHPFRYRQWIFADTGTVDGFGDLRSQLYESLPQFLQRSLRGDTDSELLFHLYLSFLHDSGQLDAPQVKPIDAARAIRSSLALLDRIGRETDHEPSRLNILLATPEYLIAAQRGEDMAYRMLAGRDDFEPLFADEGPSKMRMPDLEPCRIAVVASDFDKNVIPQGWTRVEHGSIVAFTRTGNAEVLHSS